MSTAPESLAEVLTARTLLTPGVVRVYPPNTALAVGIVAAQLVGRVPRAAGVAVDESRQTVTATIGVDSMSTWETAADVSASILAVLRTSRPEWAPTVNVTVSSIGMD